MLAGLFTLLALGCASSRQHTVLVFPYGNTATIKDLKYTPGLIVMNDKRITVPTCTSVKIDLLQEDGHDQLSVWADDQLVVSLVERN
ncbi:MAG TPA: hypothetical protein VHX44_14935 [Planctomycetota bacterium]|jgi:hypothetical protein|nr:hypothetical protein [Planctomycetota bacterium]